MNDSKCAAKLRAQLKRFLGELLPHFSRPKVSFLGDMIYGLMAGGDVKLSSICRAYRPRITMKKAGDRLCMHLNDKRIEEVLHNFIAGKVAKRIRKDTLIIVDPSDIQKPYARQMDFLSKVWDGSKGDVGSNLGYYGCMAVACENGGRRPMPMHLRFWSLAHAPRGVHGAPAPLPPCRGLTSDRSLKWPALPGRPGLGRTSGETFGEARFTGLTENCYTTNQSQESTCLTLLRNECCVGYSPRSAVWVREG